MSKYGRRHKTNLEAIEDFKKVHLNKYDYSKINYIHSRKKIEIICLKHGSFFLEPERHMSGVGCKFCKAEEAKQKRFLEKCLLKYNDKYLLNNVEYKSGRIDVLLGCKKHGYFSIKPENVLRKIKEHCPKCILENRQEVFLKKVKCVHPEYDYSLTKYTGPFNNIKIICPKHGVFKQSPHNHLRGNQCRECSIEDNMSKGERKIKDFLDKENITYIQEYVFPKFKNFEFDFFIKPLNLIIEYDGELHYKSVKYFGGDKTLKNVERRDTQKNKYCFENGIDILRIPYWDFRNIETILKEKLKIVNYL